MIGVAVVLVGIATMIVGVWVWQLQAETDARAKRADRNAQITCLRAVKLAPYSTRFCSKQTCTQRTCSPRFRAAHQHLCPCRFLDS